MAADLVADATMVGMGAFRASLSAQSPKNRVPPALERVSDSLRYEASQWQTNFMLLARISMVASGHFYVYWRKHSISFLINDLGFAYFKPILLIAVYIAGLTARAKNKRSPTISFSSSFSAGVEGVDGSSGWTSC